MGDGATVATGSVQRPRQQKRTPTATKRLRNEETRLRLIEAAAKTIGRYGYGGCSIARVTTRARMAHGTFYLHFSSQQALFDAVLPTLGALMLNVIGEAIHDAQDIIDVERRGVNANFAYLERHPYMYRVLSEAELYAPAAFRQHMDAMVGGYARSLRRSGFADAIEDRSDEALETIATMLIGARTFLLMRYGVVKNVVRPIPPRIVAAYLHFVGQALIGLGTPGRDRAVPDMPMGPGPAAAPADRDGASPPASHG